MAVPFRDRSGPVAPVDSHSHLTARPVTLIMHRSRRDVGRGRRVRFHEFPGMAPRFCEAAEAMLSEREGRIAADAQTRESSPSGMKSARIRQEVLQRGKEARSNGPAFR